MALMSKHTPTSFDRPSVEALAQGVYLLLLCSVHEATSKLLPRLQVGDVALVHDVDSPPILWKVARVAELLPGRDGVARAFYLKPASDSVIRCPVQRVYLLEAGSL
ncbi:hypothetical protein HPB49_014292 [Dermacentor silvarum]|uniref:Uncharacterized protein n=1 Tax=Dermacentor silvarum TaxID=543639 RepID=A0ACB8DJ03_DERSI|nr:hypothetical protein HPB49_014292 [Dermacentor silvarum]